jgi:DUF1009 family protein
VIDHADMDHALPPTIKFPPRRVGLLAGAGRFPLAFAEAAKAQGLQVYCVGVNGMADEEQLRAVCHSYAETPLARLGRAIRLFKRARIDRVVMAGKIEKTVLFQPFRMLRLLPDWRTLHMWYRYATDSALDYCPELLVKHGFLTRRKPTDAQWRDIRFGWDLAKEMGRLDVGQSVVINDMAVIAVEAIEGTDRTIRRAGELCRRGGFTVVKVAKPQQDMRFDVPTIGAQTIKTLQEAGGRVLAIESNKTIMLDQKDVIDLADRLGIAVVAINAEELELRLAG